MQEEGGTFVFRPDEWTPIMNNEFMSDMKRTLLLSAACLAATLFTACTQDDAGLLPEASEGIPMTFTATGLNPTAATTTGTRATVDGDWKGVTAVAIQIGNEVKEYRVTPSSDNLTATLSSDDPHYWAGESAVTVSAWWPYTDGQVSMPTVTVKADQRGDGYAESDHIGVAEELLHYNGGTPTLVFTHRTARIVVTVSSGTSSISSVRLTNLSTANGNPGEIIAHDAGSGIYEALVAPQSVTQGTAFVTIATTDGKTYVYRMQGAAEWKAGEEYTYTVSLAAAEDPGYTVSEDGNTYEVYNADGLLAWNKAVQGNLLLNCTLTDDINLTGKEWTPIGDYDNRYTGTFDGGNHTITGLTINQYGNYVGMIDFLDSGGTVQNLTLENVNITGGDIVGSVVGYNYGTVTACTASGNVSGTSRIGGVVGYNNGTVTACYHASGNVSGTSYIGGVVGRNTSGTVTACYHASGNVSGTSNVGGVVGYNISGTLTACYWSGLPDNDNGGATKVDGTTVTWQNAVDAMNTALQSAGSEWRYELTGALPTLKKQ